MKWIGQHIYDLVARFRSDIYLESISTGTIASGGNLGLDANNKIVKATETTGDITGVALTASTGIDLTSVANATGGDYAATIGVDVSDFMTNGVDNRVLTATGTDAMNAEANLTFDGSGLALTGAYDQTGDTLKVISTAEHSPSLQLHSRHNGTTCSTLDFYKDRGAAQANADRIGIINWYGEDASQNIQQYAQTKVVADNTTHGSERSSYRVSVAEYDGTLTEGFRIEGTAADGVVNAYIGSSVNAMVVVQGALYFGETMALDASGLIKIASQTGITSAANLTTVGTIGTGVWQGTAIASAYLDADTAHLSGTQTFSGTKTFSNTISGDINGNAATATALATARTIGGTSFNGTADISIAEATNLTASTETAVQLGTIELGHASDTTIARSAAGVATIESNIIQTKNKVIHLEQGTLSDNVKDIEHFFPAVTTAESEAFANVVTPLLMPVGGKLLKIHLKSNQDLNGEENSITFRLYAAGTDDRWNEGDKSLLGQKSIAGGAKRDVIICDFQSDLEEAGSSTNAFTAGDLIGISMQNSVNLGLTTKYVWTFVFELDFNSY